jgi:tetratricopeptide (TPR) repeat protein
VIGSSGGLPPGTSPPADTRLAFFGAAGRHDFNYSELLALDERLAALGLPHRFETFSGGHEWLPAELATAAIRWLDLLAIRDGVLAREPVFEAARWQDAVAAGRAAEDAGDLVTAWRRYLRIAEDFRRLRPVDDAIASASRLAAASAFAPALAREEAAEREAAAYVASATAVLGGALQVDPREVPLPSLLRELRLPALRRRAGGVDPQDVDAATRLLAMLYVQTAFYLPRSFAAGGDHRRAELCLRVATAVDPAAPEGWYALATTRARLGDRRAALAALERAVRAGFDDGERLRSDPDLGPLRADRRFAELLARAAAGAG